MKGNRAMNSTRPATTRATATKKHLALALGASLGLWLASAGTAEAQALRPNILVLFDTSGSMLYNQANDGSPLCAGANQANGQTSRIYNMKHALRDALAEVGTDEANFGLMRFPQNESAAQAFTCPEGHWNNTGTAVGGTLGCRMTTQTDPGPQTTYGPWFDSGIAQSLLIPVTLSTTGLKPAAASDYDPTGANITSLYKWIDQSDSGMTGAANPDPELRIPPNNNTPLGRSLFYARMYFENYVYPLDPRKACRQNIVIIATDGAETCDTTKANGATLNTTTCAQTPAASYGTFEPEVTACALNHSTVIPKGVQVYILTDNGLTNPEKAAANLIAAAGGTGQAIFVTLTDTTAVKSALVGIIAQNVPPGEMCNGVDENCNNLIDEGVSNNCSNCTAGNSIAACGSFVINPNDKNDPDNKLGAAAKHCAIETCNCIDDNCNGQVDEGLKPNACGGPCGCAVPPEVCNSLDDNCDGLVDNGNWASGAVGTKCNNGQIGSCNRDGLRVCNASGTDTTCDAPAGTPQMEVCNGKDDNCNGQIDEGTLPGVGEACGNGLGACQAGTIVCVNGKLVCNVVSMPKTEVCNGIDDNCDGIVDNGNFPETGQACLCPGLTQAEVGVGICKAGKLACAGALGFVCTGCVLPAATELCNGLDNNCDNKPDTTGNCPNGFGCKDGACTLQCSGGEFPCPLGYKCASNYCIPQRCATVSCPSGQHCDETNGACVDDCAGVKCPRPTQTCMQGQCVDCNDLGCDGGKICVAGVCKTDKCLGVVCQTNQACADGACVDLCEPGKCASNQRCVGGACMSDPCAGMFCNQDYFCNPASGKCELDPCLTIQCGVGNQCVRSKAGCQGPDCLCEPDPCATIQCPTDCWHCGVTNDGLGTCLLNDTCQPIETKVGQKGGGESGCSCAVDGAGRTQSWLGLMLALGALGALGSTARRRRRHS
jgi:MYXO-CTERM domain-containing protein